ncbi:DUF6479 family protein [Streptomyces silvisoli]|uniref:DUF6479 family protein n=1 Tax=Streptomyces silvisoli TaxID=3034235 RepID=A0ABT5ZVQ3_9ACTN|nr:DUF6479 family protein [Streptomyces silvisoli]MDF3293695.1 DUF6479 family protein [Streptomyces silvisoli]
MMWTFGAETVAAGFIIGPLLIGIGIVVALALVGLFYGRLRRGPGPQRTPQPPPEQPPPRARAWTTPTEFAEGEAPANHGPGHQDSQVSEPEEVSREPDEVPRDGRRRLPYELRGYPGPRT